MSKDSKIQDELSSSLTGGRLRRYAKVTTAKGGLAARLAGERYLGIKIEHAERQVIQREKRLYEPDCRYEFRYDTLEDILLNVGLSGYTEKVAEML